MKQNKQKNCNVILTETMRKLELTRKTELNSFKRLQTTREIMPMF